jgi:hypothetical protein
MAAGLARRLDLARDESGQALVLAILIVLLVSILVPVLASQLDAENTATNQTVSSEAALAAAEAGVQEYRNYLDNVPSYYAYDYGTPDGDPALTGWKQIGTSNEWFHYVPDPSRLALQTGASAGQMLLEVTGRAGVPGAYQYRSLLVSYKLSGILTDSYYSEYELSDPNEPGVLPNVTVTPAGGSATSVPMNQVQVEYNYTNQSGTTTTYGPLLLSDALCKYHTYDENTFVDSLGSVINLHATIDGATLDASALDPYYGPYYDTTGITFTVPASSGFPNAGSTIAIPSGVRPCSAYGVGIYNASVAFNGTAYTNDQFWLCGDPQYNGEPPLISGAPAGTTDVPWSYRDNWQGAKQVSILGVTYYVPQGWVDDFYDGCTGSPNWGTDAEPYAQLGGQQHLPSTTAGLISYVDGTKGNGCLYTGPTMIEFVKGGTMNVWSPLSQNTEPNYTTGTQADCGKFTPSQPWVTGLPVPVDSPSINESGVIYVQSEQSSGANSGYQTAPPVSVVDPSHLALPSGATCINPYYYNLSATSTQCTEGDAVIEGELHGQITLAASADIIVSRDLTYQCADGSGGASDVDPSTVAACNQAGTSDVLGLLANEDLLIAHPISGSSNDAICTDDGTETNPGISNVVPWSCDIGNPSGGSLPAGVVTDAAIVTLNGSTYVPSFTTGAGLGGLYENGTNINYYPGFNGVSGGAGYNQELSYDTRLSYLNPPHLLQATDTVWDIVSFVVCGTVNSANFAVHSGAQSMSCPALS